MTDTAHSDILGQAAQGQLKSIIERIERQAWRPGDPGASSHALAKRYGVTQSHMHDVLTGRRWAHVPGARSASAEI